MQIITQVIKKRIAENLTSEAFIMEALQQNNEDYLEEALRRVTNEFAYGSDKDLLDLILSYEGSLIDKAHAYIGLRMVGYYLFSADNIDTAKEIIEVLEEFNIVGDTPEKIVEKGLAVKSQFKHQFY